MKNQASLPKEFEDTLRLRLGESFDQFVTSLQQPSPVSIRHNPLKHVHLDGEPVAWSEFGKYLSERPVFTLDPALHAGAYYVQEASSMFLEQAIRQSIDTSLPVRALDLCAAPGGKSTHLLSLLNQSSLLVANEVIRSRASILSENIQKWGHSNVVITNNDPEDFAGLPGFFDLIVVDAPCSGEGLFRKDPNAMQEWSPANVDLCSKRQQRILADVWPSLKTDGILIYSTCTYNERENEENLKWLSEQHTIESVELKIDPAWNIHVAHQGSLVGYRFYPHQTKGEGFFLSVIRKKESQVQPRIKFKKRLTIPAKKSVEALRDWISMEDAHFWSWNEIIHCVPNSQVEDLEYLIDRLKIVQAGTALATSKHNKLIPEHAGALSISLNKKYFQQIALSKAEAIQYLRKDALQTEAPKGFTLVMYNSLALGWVNVLDNRVNNLYPKEWRIRMAG